jgi:predicted nucleic-acid-binding protein
MSEGSLCLDTSVVLRLLVSQPLEQHRHAIRFLREHLADHTAIHVIDLVLVEAYFALQHYYLLPKADALSALANFARHSGVTVTPVARAVLAHPDIATAGPGFVDRLIHGAGQADGHTLVTFEKAARRLPSTLLLPSA